MTCMQAKTDSSAMAEPVCAAAAAVITGAADYSSELEALTPQQQDVRNRACQQAQPSSRAETAVPSTPQRPRTPAVEQFDVFVDDSQNSFPQRTPSRDSACSADDDDLRRSPAACTFATPLVTATRLVLISPNKLGRRPTPKSGARKQRRILQSIHSGNASSFFKRSATESFGDENVGFRTTKELRWSMQSTEPSYMDAHQPYREAAQAEAELMREAGPEFTHSDWPV
jgi:hypothetical protein